MGRVVDVLVHHRRGDVGGLTVVQQDLAEADLVGEQALVVLDQAHLGVGHALRVVVERTGHDRVLRAELLEVAVQLLAFGTVEAGLGLAHRLGLGRPLTVDRVRQDRRPEDVALEHRRRRADGEQDSGVVLGLDVGQERPRLLAHQPVQVERRHDVLGGHRRAVTPGQAGPELHRVGVGRLVQLAGLGHHVFPLLVRPVVDRRSGRSGRGTALLLDAVGDTGGQVEVTLGAAGTGTRRGTPCYRPTCCSPRSESSVNTPPATRCRRCRRRRCRTAGARAGERPRWSGRSRRIRWCRWDSSFVLSELTARPRGQALPLVTANRPRVSPGAWSGRPRRRRSGPEQAQTQGEQGDHELRVPGVSVRSRTTLARTRNAAQPIATRPISGGIRAGSSGRSASTPSRATTWHAAD